MNNEREQLEKKSSRNAYMRTWQPNYRKKETTEQRETRLRRDADAKRLKRFLEEPQETVERRKTNKDYVRNKRRNRTEQQLSHDRERDAKRKRKSRKKRKRKRKANKSESGKLFADLQNEVHKSDNHNKKRKKQDECSFCAKNEINAFWLPCRHNYCCWDCALIWFEGMSSKCPYCNQQVTTVINCHTQERKCIFPKQQRHEEDVSLGDLMLHMTTCAMCGSSENEENMISCPFCEVLMHQSCGHVSQEITMCIYCASEEQSTVDSDEEYLPSEHEMMTEPPLKKRKLNLND